MINYIESNKNKIAKLIISLAQKKFRLQENRFVIEGEKFVSDIPDTWEIDFFAVSETFSLANDLSVYENRSNIIYFKDSVFNTFCDTITPQGILTVCKIKTFSIDELIKKDNPFIVILEETNDPGNLGTIIRTADAACVDGIILCKSCVDIYNPKVVRATAGSIFNIPFCTDIDINDALNICIANNIKTVVTSLKTETMPYSIDLTQGVALVIGNEARGVSQETIDKADYLTKLPIPGKAESLNASIACGILIYEVVRQRL